MFELAFIEQCADPSVEIAIVERFIAEVGTDNPLAITITDGNRLILPEAPRTPEAAMRLIERFVGQAVVRVGVTRYPAGYGISDASELSPDVVDACGNIRLGTELFGKVHRIVAHARGKDDKAVFSEALDAWLTGEFQGSYVFGEPDPNSTSSFQEEFDLGGSSDAVGEVPDLAQSPEGAVVQKVDSVDPNQAGIRVDLSSIVTVRER